MHGKKLLNRKILKNILKFLGKKPKEDIPKYLLCADVCVDSFPNEPYFAAALPIKLLNMVPVKTSCSYKCI